jgi:PIN domain nuclease of toxin-antitoxin system
MRLLLDTHAFLWLVEGSPNLSAAAQAALADTANDVYLSAASVWELAIKVGNKKLTLSDSLDVFVPKWTATYHLDTLPVRFIHVYRTVDLPAHHKDPFDRLLIAQAMVEGMGLLTSDTKFTPYSVSIVW